MATDSPSSSSAPSSSSPADLEPSISRARIRDILAGGAALFGQRVVVGGWVRTGREQGRGALAFLKVTDGSCLGTLQVIVHAAVHPIARLTAAGTSVLVVGELWKPPEGARETVELRAERVVEVGEVDAAAYPLPKGRIGLETLRDFVHLRARTETVRIKMTFVPWFFLSESKCRVYDHTIRFPLVVLVRSK
jgi:asparaginyl-tRNA synthetase